MMIILISQMRILSHQEVEQFAKDHTDKTQDFGELALESGLLTIPPTHTQIWWHLYSSPFLEDFSTCLTDSLSKTTPVIMLSDFNSMKTILPEPFSLSS